ncbi:MAG: peptidase M15 [Prevotella sp.]|nr:peptidase M15 [Prevotella sp.]
MKWFNKNEMIRCYRERQQERCRECRLQQAASRLPNGIEENIEALVEQVLDPARDRLGKAVMVNSGFRCPVHNKAVGGVYNSQHVSGQAVDVHCKDNKKLAKVIVENGRFDQLILYPTFVHVSWKRQGGNRQQILRKVGNGYEAVSRKEVLGV